MSDYKVKDFYNFVVQQFINIQESLNEFLKQNLPLEVYI